MDQRYLYHGAAPAIGAACCFACVAILVKVSAADADSQHLVFLRSFFGLLIVAPFAFYRGLGFLKTTRLGLHSLRALFSFGALSCFYFAVGEIGLAEALLLNSSSPLFIGLLAIVMLGEHLDRRALIALLIGFCGVILLLKPGSALFQLASIIGAMAGLFVAFAKIFIRQMADTEPVLRTVFYFGLCSTVISAVPLVWMWHIPSLFAVAAMLLAAAFASTGQMLLTYAFSHNRAALVAPFSYVSVVLGGIVGWSVWGEVPDLLSIFGGILVVAGCLLMVLKPKVDPWRSAGPVRDSP